MKIPAHWTFENAEVATSFDRHVREQLPWYDLATRAVGHIARHYIPRGGLVYDIGASTGNIGHAISETLSERDARLIAIESSAEMVAAYNGPGEIIRADATEFEFMPFDLGVCFLTLMFIPPAKRGGLIRTLRANIRPGGALIVFDKLLPGSGYIASILWRLTLLGKLEGGASPSDIVEKELSLRGVQRPLSPGELSGAVECFRFGDFAGWIIEAQEQPEKIRKAELVQDGAA